jgi:hypothetical protein
MYFIVGSTGWLRSLVARNPLVEGKPICAMACIPTGICEMLKLNPVKQMRLGDYVWRTYAPIAN